MSGDMTNRVFGLRIRRATDLILKQGREALDRLDLPLDAQMTSLVIALYEKPGQSSSELAATTGLSRQFEEYRLKALEKASFVTSELSPDDARKRVYALSPERREDVARFVEIMTDFECVYDALWREIGVDLGDALLRLERALEIKPLVTRLFEENDAYRRFAEDKTYAE